GLRHGPRRAPRASRDDVAMPGCRTQRIRDLGRLDLRRTLAGADTSRSRPRTFPPAAHRANAHERGTALDELRRALSKRRAADTPARASMRVTVGRNLFRQRTRAMRISRADDQIA